MESNILSVRGSGLGSAVSSKAKQIYGKLY